MKSKVFVILCAVILGVSSAEEVEFSPFVVNGVRSSVAPYFAFIQYFNTVGLGFFGGGALISNRHIVTAATNTAGFAQVRVFMGSSNRTAMREFPVNVAQITNHPAYISTSRANDISIIRLVTPIIPTAEIHPIALPPLVQPPLELPFEHEEGFFMGMGFQTIASTGPSQFLYSGFQRTTSNTRCTQFFILNTVTGFCAEDPIEGANACNGDIGNPFVISYRRQDVLAGIVSIHSTCGQWGPVAYTRITAFRPWIEQQLLT